MLDILKDTWNALAALSRLGRTQLLLVICSAVVSTILAGICTSWGGSAFFATIAFLVCDVVNAMYSITYENTFAFSSLAILLVEQNAVLTAGTAVGIMDYAPDWAPSWLKWFAVGFGWSVVAILVALQLALRKDWGWHAHKLGLARTEDVALYQRILQLEGAILLDFCQVIPCCVVLLGKYGLSSQQSEHINHNGTDQQLAHVVAILYFVSAILSVLCAPALGSSARRENTTPFGIAGFLTMCTSGCIVFGTVDALRRVGWPPVASDAILVTLVILTCLSRIALVITILRIPQAVFGSGIASRINRGNGGILLPSNIEGWSECRRSAFGGRSTSAADTEGAAMLYGNIEDYSDTESDVGNYSNPNLMYGERVRIRDSSISNLNMHIAAANNNNSSHGNLNRSQANTNQKSNPSLLSGVGRNTNPSASNLHGVNNNNNQNGSHHYRHESGNSMSTFHQQNNSRPPGMMTNDQNTTPLLSSANVEEDSHHNNDVNNSYHLSNHNTTTNGDDDDDDENNTMTSSGSPHSSPSSPNHLHQQQSSSQNFQNHQQQNRNSYLDVETSSNHSRNTSTSHRGGSRQNTISFVKANVVRRPSTNNNNNNNK